MLMPLRTGAPYSVGTQGSQRQDTAIVALGGADAKHSASNSIAPQQSKCISKSAVK